MIEFSLSKLIKTGFLMTRLRTSEDNFFLLQDAFADFFSDQSAVEDKVWKGLLFTATLGGIGALAAVMAR